MRAALGYKIPAHPAAGGVRLPRRDRAGLRAIARVPPDPASIDFLVNTLHPRHGQPYLPCVPFDVISKIADRSRYLDQPAAMTPELVEWAWTMYFGSPDRPPQVHSRTQAT